MRRVTPLLLVVVLAAGAGAAGGWSLSGASGVTAARVAPCPKYATSGSSTFVSYAHPTTLSLDCDSVSNFVVLNDLAWHGWGQPTATATAIVNNNQCPAALDCVLGQNHHAHVTVYVSQLRTYDHVALYERLFISGGGPSVNPRWWLFPLNAQTEPNGI